MDEAVKATVGAKDIQLIDWMILEYSAKPIDSADVPGDGAVTVESEVTKHTDNLYLLKLAIGILPPSEDQKSFEYRCRAEAKFVALDGSEKDDHEARIHIATDGATELYTLVKGYVFMMTGNTETDPITLPSIAIVPGGGDEPAGED